MNDKTPKCPECGERMEKSVGTTSDGQVVAAWQCPIENCNTVISDDVKGTTGGSNHTDSKPTESG